MCAAQQSSIPADDSLASPWDPGLAELMRREQRAVHEKTVAEILLDDLARPSSPTHS